jgi:hypothetical protein
MNTKLNLWLVLFAGSLIFSPVLAVSAEEAVEEAAAEEAVVEEAVVEEAAAEVAVAEEAEAAAEPAEAATAATTGSGVVVSINVAEQYVVLDSGVAGEDGVTETAIYYFNEGVKIVKGGQEVTTSDLTEGDKVSIEYSTDEDDNKVISTLTVE